MRKEHGLQRPGTSSPFEILKRIQKKEEKKQEESGGGIITKVNVIISSFFGFAQKRKRSWEKLTFNSILNLKRIKKIVSLHNKVNKKRTKENRGILQKKLKEKEKKS